MPSLLCRLFKACLPLSLLLLLPHWLMPPGTSYRLCLSFRCHLDVAQVSDFADTRVGWGRDWGTAKRPDMKVRNLLRSFQRTPHRQWPHSHISSQKKIRRRTKCISSLKKSGNLSSPEGSPSPLCTQRILSLQVSSLPAAEAGKDFDHLLASPISSLHPKSSS